MTVRTEYSIFKSLNSRREQRCFSTQRRRTLLYSISLWTLYLFLQTVVLRTNAIDDAGFNQTNISSIDSETTVSWLQFMEEDARTDVEAHYDNSSYYVEETTMSWLQFMEKDAQINDEIVYKEVSRVKRESGTLLEAQTPEPDEYSASGSGMETTSELMTTAEATNTAETTITTIESTTEGLEVSSETMTIPEATDMAETTIESTTEGMEVSSETMTIPEATDTAETTIESTTAVMEVSSETPTPPEATDTAETTITTTTVESTTDDMEGSSETMTPPEATDTATSETDTLPEVSPSATSTQTTTTAPDTGSTCSDCGDNEYCVENVARCECIPGYVLEGGNCTPVKQFGGELHSNATFDVELNNESSPTYIKAKKEYEDVLKVAYGGEDWFRSVEVNGFKEGSTIAFYILVTKDSDEVDSTEIQRTFSEFLTNETYFRNCSCSDDLCNSTTLNMVILAKQSCEDAGNSATAVCSSPSIISYCNNETTDCMSNEGNVFCECKSGYMVNTTSDRTCMAVWLFTLVVTLSCLVVIAIVVGIVVYCRRKKKNKAWKSKKGNDYHFGDGLSLSAIRERYQSRSIWDQPVRGVYPTSFKPANDDEFGYDNSMFEDDNTRMTIKRPEIAVNKTAPVSNWRVSELSNGDRYKVDSDGQELDGDVSKADEATEQTKM